MSSILWFILLYCSNSKAWARLQPGAESSILPWVSEGDPQPALSSAALLDKLARAGSAAQRQDTNRHTDMGCWQSKQRLSPQPQVQRALHKDPLRDAQDERD